MSLPITPSLKAVLMVDAVISGATAGLLIAASALMGPLLDLPPPLLFWAGIVLAPFVVALVVLATRETAPRIVVLNVVLINVAWVIASFGLLGAGLVEPNLLGVLFISAQALTVALFAVLQASALRAARTLAV